MPSSGRAGCPQPAAVGAHGFLVRDSSLNGNEFCELLYLTYQILVSPAAESVVYDNGALHVRRHGQEVSIPVSFITGIRGRLGINPETITLDLSKPTAIGSSVTFIPPARFPSFKDHPMMATLRELMARPPSGGMCELK